MQPGRVQPRSVACSTRRRSLVASRVLRLVGGLALLCNVIRAGSGPPSNRPGRAMPLCGNTDSHSQHRRTTTTWSVIAADEPASLVIPVGVKSASSRNTLDLKYPFERAPAVSAARALNARITSCCGLVEGLLPVLRWPSHEP